MLLNAYAKLFSFFLKQSWRDINEIHLKGSLQLPVFHISESSSRLGSWARDERTLSISAKLLTHHAETEILEVLKHEMAHQYVDEVLGGCLEETAHGSAFRHACGLLGIAHNARMSPQSKPSPVMQRISKLLALAQSQNEFEASAAMAKAQDLMARYELETAEIPDDFYYQYLGQPRRQKSAAERLIACVLLEFFHVEAVWVSSTMIPDYRKVWLLEICGSKANLEVASYVYDYLMQELKWLWLQHRRLNPTSKSKRDYQVGVLQGFMTKLSETEKDPNAGNELVLLKHARLGEFFQGRHPNLTRGRPVNWRESESFLAGYDEGQELEIRKGVKSGSTSGRLDKSRRITS